ncbi:MAG: glycosyltransferase family 1 protein [Bacteroidota bacterium]
MFKIAFDAKRLFLNFTGLGNYSRTLVKDLAEQFPEHAYYLYSPSIRPHQQNQFFIDHPSFFLRQSRLMPGALWRSLGLKKDLKKDGIQIYHGLSNEIPQGIAQSSIKSIVTIHDLIFKTFPQQFPWLDQKIYDAKFRYACQNADQIIAISQQTKKDIIYYYQIPEEKIEVIYQSCAGVYDTVVSQQQINAVRQKYELPEEYLLYVGAINERKNLLSILKALPLLPKSLSLPLVVVGRGKKYQTLVQVYAQQNQLNDQIHWLGQASQADLPTLYQAARLFIYPSFYEGFGIPIIEALHSRTPVITSKVSALPEAAGPGAHYIDPKQPEDLAQGITTVLSDESYARQLVEKGYQHVLQFNNLESSKQVMNLYLKLFN